MCEWLSSSVPIGAMVKRVRSALGERTHRRDNGLKRVRSALGERTHRRDGLNVCDRLLASVPISARWSQRVRSALAGCEPILPSARWSQRVRSALTGCEPSGWRCLASLLWIRPSEVRTSARTPPSEPSAHTRFRTSARTPPAEPQPVPVTFRTSARTPPSEPQAVPVFAFLSPYPSL